LQEIDVSPQFGLDELWMANGSSPDVAANDAFWDVVFARLATVQEYGWHAGLEPLMWASDALNGAVSRFDWPQLHKQLVEQRASWTRLVIEHAKQHHAFFPAPDEVPTDEVEV
jgi:hypothetical protein